MDKKEVKCNEKLRRNKFSVNVSVLAVVFRQQFSKNRQFQAQLSFFEICWRNTIAKMETFAAK